jgi:hypothetical protein
MIAVTTALHTDQERFAAVQLNISNESAARFGRLDSSSSGSHSYTSSLVHSELSRWGLKSFSFACCTYAQSQLLQH